MSARLVWLTDDEIRVLRQMVAMTHETLAEGGARLLAIITRPEPSQAGRARADLARIALPGVTEELAALQTLAAKLRDSAGNTEHKDRNK